MAHLDISILGQQYKMGCPDGEEENLAQSVKQFNEKLKSMKQSAPGRRNEQLIVMAALNYCHQLNVEKIKNEQYTLELNQRIQTLQDSIEQALRPKDEDNEQN
ncbi:cell division protein ZapA [Psychromonas sp. psych-6C06]|uniref:cell division protein ZapA n=1 Tax=Psychromonas sp. psych-6C06 TaxID=2058089 RepID=UPI000C32EB7B|nr:cell division protein ZapA [Psychromonas sp. psych-6C06]PKF61923.1 cell division protein ZapA [Psychromonas sp. psych-6C06]